MVSGRIWTDLFPNTKSIFSPQLERSLIVILRIIHVQKIHSPAPLSQGICMPFFIFCNTSVTSRHTIAKELPTAHTFFLGGGLLQRKLKLSWNAQREYYRMKPVNDGNFFLFRYIFRLKKSFIEHTFFWCLNTLSQYLCVLKNFWILKVPEKFSFSP